MVFQEVVLNELEEMRGLLFASLDMLFLDLKLSLGVVVAGALDDRTTARCHQLSLIGDLLNCLRDCISFDHTVLVHEVLFVNPINSVLHIAVSATCTNIYIKPDESFCYEIR